MPKVLIAKDYWSSSMGQMFYDLKSVIVEDIESIGKFIEMVEELGYVVLLIGEYQERSTERRINSNTFKIIDYSYPNTVQDIINFYLEGEKEYGDCFKQEADIVRKYYKTKVKED